MSARQIGTVATGTSNEISIATMVTTSKGDKGRRLMSISDDDGDVISLLTDEQARDLRKMIDIHLGDAK